MGYKINHIACIVVLSFLLGSSCSDEPKLIETVTVFEHTFHCVPVENSNGSSYHEATSLDISEIPLVDSLRKKISTISIERVSTAFVVHDEFVHQTTGFMITCPVAEGTNGACVGLSYHELYNQMEYTVPFENFTFDDLEKSFMKHGIVFLEVHFSFLPWYQGYPIESFDVVVKFEVTITSEE